MNFLKSISAYLGVPRIIDWATEQNQIRWGMRKHRKNYKRDVEFFRLGKQDWEVIKPILQVFRLRCTNLNLKSR